MTALTTMAFSFSIASLANGLLLLTLRWGLSQASIILFLLHSKAVRSLGSERLLLMELDKAPTQLKLVLQGTSFLSI